MLSKVLSNGKQNVEQYAKILGPFTHGEVSELADEHDLGSCAARRGGSNPPFPTSYYLVNQLNRPAPTSPIAAAK